MEKNRKQIDRACDDCDRRDFIKWSAGAAAAATAWSVLPRSASAAPTPKSDAEVAIKEFYGTLTDAQKKQMAFDLDDERRTKINANWSITPANIGSFAKAQQELIHNIIRGVTSEDGYERLTKQMTSDWGSVEKYTVAVFGNPNEGPFEFELTGRHLTLRADGDTLTAAGAFGGPIVYGHSAPGNSEKNLFSYQTRRANEVFAALDEKQRKQALLAKAPRESDVQVRGAKAELPGIGGGDLSEDQQDLLLAALRDVMAPYRKEDVDEVMSLVETGGGVEQLHMAFYESGDLAEDGVWDIWRIEGPTVVCHFRGAPHVHAYINVAKPSA